MSNAIRLGDSITGTTTGEHSGHYRKTKHGRVPKHGSGTIHGRISGGCSHNVYINGKPAAINGAITKESDNCCSNSSGYISGGSSKVYINGKPALRKCDNVHPHNGSARITSYSDNVFIGG